MDDDDYKRTAIYRANLLYINPGEIESLNSDDYSESATEYTVDSLDINTALRLDDSKKLNSQREMITQLRRKTGQDLL